MEKIGLIIGRFDPLHVGHEYLINYALSKCDKLLIFIGSANKNLSLSNPFSYEEREMMLKSVFDNRIIVAPLNDIGVGNVPAWGNYIISSALKYVSNIDYFFYGDEAKCNLWFDEKAKKNIQFVPLSREHINIHGTNIREYLLNDDIDSFKKYTNQKLHYLYKDFRSRILDLYNKED